MRNLNKKFLLVSFRINNSKKGRFSQDPKKYRKKRREQLSQIIDFAHDNKVSHILLPGWTFVYARDENLNQILRADLEWLTKEAKELSIIGETRLDKEDKELNSRLGKDELGTFFIEKGKLLPKRMLQGFWESKQVKQRTDDYAKVANGIFNRERTVEIDGIRFLLIVCGENNLLTNEQKNANKVKLRHEIDGQNLENLNNLNHDIVFNPAHTQMGNLGKMKRRWEALSLPREEGVSRLAIFVTNTNKKRGRSSMYVFKNGKEIPLTEKTGRSESDGWRSDIIYFS